MILLTILLAILFVGRLPLFSQDTLFWKKGISLTWDDFRKTPDDTSRFYAISTVAIGYSLSFDKRSFSAIVYTRFHREKSWTKLNTAELLRHEQGHFDIGEIYARRLRKAFREYQFNYTTVQADLAKIYKQINEEKRYFNSQYDQETNFSINSEEQRRWDLFIRAELNKLRFYEN